MPLRLAAADHPINARQIEKICHRREHRLDGKEVDGRLNGQEWL